MRRAVLPVMLLLGCKIDLDEAPAPPDAADPDVGRTCRTSTNNASCLDLAERSDFSAIQTNILERNCSGNSCHSPMGSGVLDFSRDMAYESLMGPSGTGVMSSFSAQHKLVEPGNPSQSYLMFLLQAIPAEAATPAFLPPPDDVGYMPMAVGNATILCCQKIDAIERWITAGAQP